MSAYSPGSQGSSQRSSQIQPQDSSRRGSQRYSQASSQGQPQDSPHRSLQGTPRDSPHRSIQGQLRDSPHRSVQGTPRDSPHRSSQGQPQHSRHRSSLSISQTPQASSPQAQVQAPAPAPSSLPPAAIGYPYVCEASYDGRYDGTVQIQKGTMGKVLNVNDAGWVMVSMPWEVPQRQGWVPFTCIKVGNTRKFGNISFDMGITMQPSNIPSSSQTNDSQLARAILELLAEFNHQRKSLKCLPSFLLAELGDSLKRTNLRNKLLGAVLPPVRKVLDKPDFKIQELAKAIRPIAPTGDLSQGVYVRIYRFSKSAEVDMSRRLPEQYVGKTNDMSRRQSAHHRASLDEKNKQHSNHYRSARDSTRSNGKWIYGVLMETNNENLRTVGEQIMILLLETYSPHVLKLGGNSTTSTGVDAEDAKSFDQDVAKWAGDRETATVLTQAANRSYARSRWPKAASRGSYGAGAGLNWRSPLIERMSNEEIIWTKSRIPYARKPFSVYRRPESNIQAATHDARRALIFVQKDHEKGEESRFWPYVGLSKEVLPAGTKIWVCIEVMEGIEPHEYPFMRAPTVGPFTFWDEARTLGIKIEWQDSNGGWKFKYLSVSKWYNLRSTRQEHQVRGAYNCFSQALSVVRAIKQQQTRADIRPPWLMHYRPQRVKELVYDHLNQVFRLQEIPRILNERQPPIRRQLARMANDYNLAGLRSLVQRNDYGPGVRPPWQRKHNQWDKNGVCDSCYLQAVRSRRWNNQRQRFEDDLKMPWPEIYCRPAAPPAGEKDLPPGNCQCERCNYLFRPCTWTTAIHDCPLDDPRILALMPRELREEEEICDMDDPRIQTNREELFG